MPTNSAAVAHGADYVIVGAGSAGCVLASRLSEDPSCQVVLIEAGSRSRHPWLHIPIGYFKTMGDPRFDWKFLTEPEPGMAGRRIPFPRGRGIGGSSLINGMLYLRGHARDYDQWAALRNPGWDWEAVLPYFERSVQPPIAGDAHGQEAAALLTLSKVPPDTVSDAFVAAAAHCGIPGIEDFNQGSNHGAGYFHMTMSRGRRMSTAKAFLRTAIDRPNLRVISGAHATRVLMDKQRARGVRAVIDGQLATINADREVILCAGAIQSPHLLQLSGIGPHGLLRRHGVDVVLDLPGVGQNLQDHLQLRPTFRCKGVVTLNQVANNPMRGAWELAKYLSGRGGALKYALHRAGAFFSVLSDPEWPDAQIHLALLSLEERDLPPHSFPGITMSGCNLRPESRGAVELGSDDPHKAPLILPNYLSTDADRRHAVAMLRRIREIAASAPLSGLIVNEHEPGASIGTDEEILAWARRRGSSIFHPVGTCAMGPEQDPLSVVDAQLRVHGIDGLRVVDGSIMPRLVSGNTNAPIIMIAEKASDLIRRQEAPPQASRSQTAVQESMSAYEFHGL